MTRYFPSPAETPAASASGTPALDAKSAPVGHGEGALEFHRRVGDEEGNKVFAFAPLFVTICLGPARRAAAQTCLSGTGLASAVGPRRHVTQRYRHR
jgi:hypothetical protein